MILLLIVLFLVLPVAGGLAVLAVARRAPEGFEDDQGFQAIATPAGAETRATEPAADAGACLDAPGLARSSPFRRGTG
jgi:hypothetical protein